MATTTTNFGWDIPQSTDLVKDGATAIAALGQDIDTALVDLKGGTTGQLLTKASGTDLDFSWASPAGGGKILQVVQGTYSTTVSTTSTSYVTTNLTASITPSASTSKILIHYALVANNGGDNTRTTIYRGTVGSGTNLGTTNGFATAKNANTASSSYLDSPATTSATTYTIAGKVDSGTAYFFDGDTRGTIILMEVGA